MKLRPLAWFFSVTSPAPGAGTATSSQRMTSGPPVSWMRIAFAFIFRSRSTRLNFLGPDSGPTRSEREAPSNAAGSGGVARRAAAELDQLGDGQHRHAVAPRVELGAF